MQHVAWISASHNRSADPALQNLLCCKTELSTHILCCAALEAAEGVWE